MLKLTYDNFLKARAYIFAHADEITRAWFDYHFEHQDTDVFMDVLSTYQHENGGFGGLVYEFDYQGPCLKSTEIAIEYILGLTEKPSAQHPVIRKMMAYILGQYLPEIGNWGESAVPEVNDGVHCRWARFRGETPPPMTDDEECIQKYDANEKVCFAAFVVFYSELVPEDMYRDIIKYPIAYIIRYYDEHSPVYDKAVLGSGPYDFEYFQWLVHCLKDKAVADKLTAILCQHPTAFMELDYTTSDTDYVHLPCDVVSSPHSVVYDTVKDLVDDSLEYRMQQQSDNGRWLLGWSFGEGEGLCKLQVLCEASRTLSMLVKLKRFGRIDCEFNV